MKCFAGVSIAGRWRRRLLASAGLCISYAVPGFGQVPVPVPVAVTDDATIVVTGSLINNPGLVQSSPVSVIGADEMALRQSNVAEDILRTIPGIVPSIGSAVNNGNGGASYVDLRGLGINRNLVLLDGTRLVPAGPVSAADLNSLPLSMLERTDILTGGASTTYGADAVAGVVNFITRKDFSGVELNASEQISEKGDGNTWRADLTVGGNFDDGKGNAVFSIGYQKADPVFQGARDFGVFNISSFSGLRGGSPTAVPSFVTGARNAEGTANLGRSQIDPATGLAGTAATLFNFNPFNLYATPFERFNMFGSAHYEIADNINVYTQGIFSKNRVKTIAAPSGSFNEALSVPLSNPYLPAGLRNQFCASDVDPDAAVYTPRFTPAECAAAASATNPNDPVFRTVDTEIGRRFVEAGTRNTSYTTTFFQYKAGIGGSITDRISFDVFGAYGENENVAKNDGGGLLSRLVNAIDATNPDTCLGRDARCVPINLFGPSGSITPEQLAYVAGVSTTSTTFSRLGQVHGVVSGDVGFSSPGANDPISFAIGAEYRRYTAGTTSDLPTTTPGEILGGGGATPDSTGSYDVKEAFGEINAPLLQDAPFAHSLTLELGGRYSDYSSSGGNSTWKVGGSWEPVAGLKFRGNYQKAVRAPDVSELFAPNVTALASLGNDPCAGAAPVGNANLRAICIAQGAPANTIGAISNPSSNQPNATVGGNRTLGVERARTYTFGVVVTPTAVPGLSVTVDYYHIRITDAVSAPTVGDQINDCFGAGNPGLALTPFCTASFGRNPLTGGLDGSTATTPGIFLPLSNLGTILTDGIDVSANYRRGIGFARLALSFQGNWTHRAKFQASPSSLFRECVGFYSSNCGGVGSGSIQPKFSFNQRTTLTVGAVDLSLLWRYIDGVRQEPDDIVNGNGPVFEGFGTIGAKHYFDLTGRVAVNDQLSLILTVQNLLDQQPPFVGTGVGTTAFNGGNTYPSTYDTIGRRFAVSARLRF
jgi:iron complex outermembrane recepter protein